MFRLRLNSVQVRCFGTRGGGAGPEAGVQGFIGFCYRGGGGSFDRGCMFRFVFGGLPHGVLACLLIFVQTVVPQTHSSTFSKQSAFFPCFGGHLLAVSQHRGHYFISCFFGWFWYNTVFFPAVPVAVCFGRRSASRMTGGLGSRNEYSPIVHSLRNRTTVPRSHDRLRLTVSTVGSHQVVALWRIFLKMSDE